MKAAGVIVAVAVAAFVGQLVAVWVRADPDAPSVRIERVPVRVVRYHWSTPVDRVFGPSHSGWTFTKAGARRLARQAVAR